VDVNGLLLTVVVTAASIPDRDAAHRLLAALRGSFSTTALAWADGGYPRRLLIWAKDVLTLTMQIIKHLPGATGFHLRPRIWVVKRSFAWISRCVRDYQTRPDHHEAMVHLANHHDHDQATRPNLTLFKNPLRHRLQPAWSLNRVVAMGIPNRTFRGWCGGGASLTHLHRKFGPGRSKSVLEAGVSELVDAADLAQGSAGVGVVEELGAAQRQPAL
jgi:hypothetical protein